MKYANQTPVQGFRGRMTVPRQLNLVETTKGLLLQQTPVSTLRMPEARFTDANVSAKDLNAAFAEMPSKTAFSLHTETTTAFSLAYDNSDSFFMYDQNSHTVVINRAFSRNCFDHAAYATADTTKLAHTLEQPTWLNGHF